MSDDFKIREELYIRRHIGPDLDGKLKGTERHQWTITDSVGRAPVLTAADVPVVIHWLAAELNRRHPSEEAQE